MLDDFFFKVVVELLDLSANGRVAKLSLLLGRVAVLTIGDLATRQYLPLNIFLGINNQIKLLECLLFQNS